MQKTFGRDDIYFLKKIARIIWKEKDSSSLNINGLTIEELRELDRAGKKIEEIMRDYGLNRYSMSDDDWQQIVEEFNDGQ